MWAFVNKTAVKTFLDREGLEERDYNFSEEMLDEMITDLSLLITKYSGSEWNWRPTAQCLVELLEEHRDLLEIEIPAVQSGARKLTNRDVLGRQTRKELFGDELVWKVGRLLQRRYHCLQKLLLPSGTVFQ